MSELESVLLRLQNGYDALFNALETYPAALRDEPGACRTWSPRQIIAHLSGWLAEVDRRFDRFDAGGTDDIKYDVDAFNDEQVALRENLSWDDTVAETRERLVHLVERAQTLTPEQITREPRYVQWLKALARDAERHLLDLQNFAGVV